jgi:hypothetical protein
MVVGEEENGGGGRGWLENMTYETTYLSLTTCQKHGEKQHTKERDHKRDGTYARHDRITSREHDIHADQFTTTNDTNSTFFSYPLIYLFPQISC